MSRVYKIQTLNKISAKGLALLPPEGFSAFCDRDLRAFIRSCYNRVYESSKGMGVASPLGLSSLERGSDT